MGAHPSALAAIFGHGTPTDPEELGEEPRALLLAFEGLAGAHLALRPAVRAASRGTSALWKGVRFDHGGNAGANVALGRAIARFRAERAPSLIDAEPALVLSYDKAGFPWSKLRDELRTVADGIAIGPTFRGGSLVGWFGLSRR